MDHIKAFDNACMLRAMAATSYFWGQKHYPIPYDVSRILLYMAGAVVLWWGCEQVAVEGVVRYGVRAVVLVGYMVALWRMERPFSPTS